MLDVTTQLKWLHLFEALASEVRLKIIHLLIEQPLNIKQLAEQLQLSSAIVTMQLVFQLVNILLRWKES